MDFLLRRTLQLLINCLLLVLQAIYLLSLQFVVLGEMFNRL